MQDKFSYCEQLVREADKDRFLASLFAPADRRSALLALYAFNVEVARVRELVHEALAGEVRLQWWRDALKVQAHGEVRANPVADALLDTITRFKLPIALLDRLIEARTFDLYDDPMRSVPDLDVTAVHAGIAYAIAGLLRAFPIHAARGQLYIPADLLERHAVRREDIFAGKASEGLQAALAEMRQHVRQHLAELDEWRSLVPPEASPAFLPVALVPTMLALMERPHYDPFKVVELPQWRRQWTMWRAARRDFSAA